MSLLNRFPKISQVAPVYAMIVLMVYSWTIMWFYWKLPSWLSFMTVDEILIIVAYIIATNFLESLCVLLIPVLLCVVLPKRWFYDSFVVRGASLVMLGLGYSMYFSMAGFSRDLLHLVPQVTIVIFFLVFLLGRITILRRIIESLADRAVVLLYLSIPVSVFSVFLVIVRNVF